MFRKILYPTDFSDCATKALEYVKKLRDTSFIGYANMNLRHIAI
ncbi:MAG: universal stress protein [Methanophagales archaeon]|nr:universal stress protein [Methanophagales archaeon]